MNATTRILAFGFVAFMALLAAEAPAGEEGLTAANLPAEGRLESFLEKPTLDIRQVHEGGPHPNVVVTVEGTILAVWGGVKLRRSEDGGETWGPEIMIAEDSIYLHFESGGSKVARFNLAWLLQGEKTADGELPSWLSN